MRVPYVLTCKLPVAWPLERMSANLKRGESEEEMVMIMKQTF